MSSPAETVPATTAGRPALSTPGGAVGKRGVKNVGGRVEERLSALVHVTVRDVWQDDLAQLRLGHGVRASPPVVGEPQGDHTVVYLGGMDID